ncbi:hypothetical protein ABZ826_38470 [Streptomyces sp. NPDC047515]
MALLDPDAEAGWTTGIRLRIDDSVHAAYGKKGARSPTGAPRSVTR